MKLSSPQWIFAGGIALACITVFTSWQQSPAKVRIVPSRQDTIPSGRDFDKELKEIANARLQMEKVTLVDLAGMEQQLAQSLSQLDAQKFELKAQQDLQKLNLAKLVESSLQAVQQVDFDKILREIETEEKLTGKERQKAMEDVKKAKLELQRELKNRDWEKELKDVNWKEIEKDLEAAKADMRKAQEEIGKEGSGIRAEMKRAGEELNEAENEIKGYQQMVYDMEAAGLLETKSDYTIEWKRPSLTINGKLQSKETVETYSKYFKKDQTLLKKKNGRINIQHP